MGETALSYYLDGLDEGRSALPTHRMRRQWVIQLLTPFRFSRIPTLDDVQTPVLTAPWLAANRHPGH